MFDILMKVFGRSEKKSGQIAKERLQVVLIHDRASVSPEIMEQLKGDIITVNEMEISLENDANSVALVANIPVHSMRHGK